MNGRIYDPIIGRFLQVDPVIAEPYNLQSYNAYSYVHNNPLSYTDPTGLSAWTEVRRPIASIAAAAFVYYTGMYYLGPQFQLAITAASGFAAGGVGGGTLQSATRGAFTALAFYGVGELSGAHAAEAAGIAMTSAERVSQFAGHAAVGCASAVASGGSCGSGAAAAGFAVAVGPVLPGARGSVLAYVSRAIAGGIGSTLGGGKFANGAVTGVFGYLFNELGTCIQRGYCTVTNRRSEATIMKLHPSIRKDAINLLNSLEEEGLNVVMTDGLRTTAEQNAIPSANTRVKGGYSFHNYGLAFDIYFENATNRGARFDLSMTERVAQIAADHGFSWGGDWRTFKDLPHFERSWGYKASEYMKMPLRGDGYVNILGDPTK